MIDIDDGLDCNVCNYNCIYLDPLRLCAAASLVVVATHSCEKLQVGKPTILGWIMDPCGKLQGRNAE